MASDINSCMFTGRLTRAPRFGTARSGVSYASLDIASNQSVYDPDSSTWVESTTYVDCVAFSWLADRIRDMGLTTGTRVAVSGRLRLDSRIVPGTDIVYRYPSLVLDSIDAATPKAQPWKARAWRNRTDM